MFRVVLVTTVFIVFFTGCKKDSSSDIEVEPILKPVSLSDSIYFEVDGKVYTSNDASFSTSIGNSGVDMKFSDVDF